MTDELEKAAHYRGKAEELRTIAHFHKETRDALVRIAEIYEDMAATMEGMAEQARTQNPETLGDVLYAKSKARVPEQDWTTLVRSIAAGDEHALHALYERAHGIVFIWTMRLTASRKAAEALTVDVFHDLWRGASRYDAANFTVLGWVMNRARSRLASCVRPEHGNALQADAADLRAQAESLRMDLAALAPDEMAARFASLPTGLPRATPALQQRLALRIAGETGKPPVMPRTPNWTEPDWEQVAPGIDCKLLASDSQRQRISMLVRLAPGGRYPAHTHAGMEELHLLDGELWIDERKLFPGDYNYAAPGTGDDRVWSETGCTCLLVTSTNDVLR